MTGVLVHQHFFREWTIESEGHTTHMGEWRCIYCGEDRDVLEDSAKETP
jgi:hypothetical protein